MGLRPSRCTRCSRRERRARGRRAPPPQPRRPRRAGVRAACERRDERGGGGRRRGGQRRRRGVWRRVAARWQQRAARMRTRARACAAARPGRQTAQRERSWLPGRRTRDGVAAPVRVAAWARCAATKRVVSVVRQLWLATGVMAGAAHVGYAADAQRPPALSRNTGTRVGAAAQTPDVNRQTKQARAHLMRQSSCAALLLAPSG
jgi:hypothetical protein